jgi:adenine-specific DNA glycosylase
MMLTICIVKDPILLSCLLFQTTSQSTAQTTTQVVQKSTNQSQPQTATIIQSAHTGQQFIVTSKLENYLCGVIWLNTETENNDFVLRNSSVAWSCMNNVVEQDTESWMALWSYLDGTAVTSIIVSHTLSDSHFNRGLLLSPKSEKIKKRWKF